MDDLIQDPNIMTVSSVLRKAFPDLDVAGLVRRRKVERGNRDFSEAVNKRSFVRGRVEGSTFSRGYRIRVHDALVEIR